MTSHFRNTHDVGCQAGCLKYTISLSLHGPILRMRRLRLREVIHQRHLTGEGWSWELSPVRSSLAPSSKNDFGGRAMPPTIKENAPTIHFRCFCPETDKVQALTSPQTAFTYQTRRQKVPDCPLSNPTGRRPSVHTTVLPGPANPDWGTFPDRRWPTPSHRI